MNHLLSSSTQRLFLLGTLLLVSCAKPESKTAEKPVAEAWSLATPQAAKPANAVKLGAYELIPPAEMRLIPAASKPDRITVVGPVRKDETYLTLSVVVVDIPAGYQELSLEEWLQDASNGVKNNRDDCTIQEPQRGTINGQPFIRVSWTGSPNKNARAGLVGKTVHGMVYLGKFENQIVQLLFQDTEPDHAESLKLGEAAVASFRKVK